MTRKKNVLRFVTSLGLATVGLVALFAAFFQLQPVQARSVQPLSEIQPATAMVETNPAAPAAAAPASRQAARSAQHVLTVCSSGCDHTSVQAAVSAVASGGSVKVAQGTYGDDNGDGRVVYITHTLTLQGGYTPSDWGIPQPDIYPTLLDAGGNGQVVVINNNVTATVAGFHIRNASTSAQGGGVYVGSGNSIIQGNWIYNNVVNSAASYNGGGGLYLAGGRPIIRDNAIYNNTAILTGTSSAQGGGGGIYVYNGGARIEYNTLWGNTTRTTSGFSGGGGVYIYGNDALTVSVRYNTIATNTAQVNDYPGGGGGVYIEADNSLIEYNAIYSNTLTIADDTGGGGIFAGSNRTPGSPIIRGNTLYKNAVIGTASSKKGGGGIYLFNSPNARVESNIIRDNLSAGLRGGGLAIIQDSGIGKAAIHSNLIQANTAAYGGGIYVFQMGGIAMPTIFNNTLYANQANSNSGGGLYRQGGSPDVRNNIFANNTNYGIYGSLVAYYSDFWSNSGGDCGGSATCTAGDGNLFSNPSFAAAGVDFQLQANSPCINTAHPITYAVVDLAGYGRPFGSRADIGAYEYYAGDCFARINGVGQVFTAVQTAVDSATPGDDVRVAGVCQGVTSRLVNGNTLYQSVYIAQGLALRGGYTLTNWQQAAAPTVLDALGGGRALYITGTQAVTVEGFVLRNGQANASLGGGLYLARVLPARVQNVVFYSNTAGSGGGFASASGSPQLYYNTFVNNLAFNNGGAMYLGAGTPVINSSIVATNGAASNGGGVYAAVGSNPALDYNNFWNNSPAHYGGNVSHGGPHDLAHDPHFADEWTRLRYDSPLLHMADPAQSLAYDFEGDARPQGRGRDIGADEASDYLDVAIGPDSTQSIAQNQSVTYTHFVTNTGTVTGTYSLIHSANVTWNVAYPLAPITLAPGQAQEVWMRVDVPANVLSGTQGLITLTVASQLHPYLQAHAVDTTNINLWPGADLAPSYTRNTNPGSSRSYEHILTNSGTGMDSYTLTVSSDHDWATLPTTVITNLGAGLTASVWVNIAVPATTPGGVTETVHLQAYSHYSPVVYAEVTDIFAVNHTVGTRYVAIQAPAASDVFNNCMVYITPCKTIAHTLDQAVSGDTVKVAAGTYNEHDLTLNEDLTVRGGYDSQLAGFTGIVYTLSLGFQPIGITVNPATNRIYAVNAWGSVEVIDGHTLKRIATVMLGYMPSGQLAVNPDTNLIYVVNYGSNTVSVIDGFRNTVIATIGGIDSPRDVDVHPEWNLVYVLSDLGDISVVDGFSHEVIDTMSSGGGFNLSIAVNPKTDRAYVGKEEPDSVVVIDLWTKSIIGQMRAIGYPAVNPTTNRVYIGNYQEPHMSMADGTDNDILDKVTLPDPASIPTIHPVKNCVYVASPGKSKLSIVDGGLNMVLKTLTVRSGSSAQNVAVNTTTGLIYVIGEDGIIVVQDATCGTWANYDFGLNPTVVNAQQQGRVLDILGNPTVEGLTLQNGLAGGGGGGVYIGMGSPTLQWNTILSSTAGINGGGVYVGPGNAIVRKNVIRGNSAGLAGGGIYNDQGAPTLAQNILANNTAQQRGGGAALGAGSPQFWSNIVYGNQAIAGGGVYAGGNNPEVWHNTLYANSAEQGGGAYIAASGAPLVKNNILVNNSASLAGGGVYNASTNILLDYNNAWHNTAPGGSGHYAGVSPGFNGISANPLFLDVNQADFHLPAYSPCVDRGLTTTVSQDWDEQPRTMGWAPQVFPDIGADEYQEAGLMLTPDHLEGAEYPDGQAVFYVHTLTNTGNASDTFDLSWSNSHNWRVLINDKAVPITISLAAGESRPILIKVGPMPKDAISGTINTTVITASSQFDSRVFATAVDTTITLLRTAGVTLETDMEGSQTPWEWITYTQVLTNGGNYTDTLDVTLTGWDLSGIDSPEAKSSSYKVGPNQAVTLTIWVSIPLELCYTQLYNTLTAISTYSPTVTDTSSITTTILPTTGLTFIGGWARIVSSPTAPITVAFPNFMLNLNNCTTETYNISLENVEPIHAVAFSPKSVTLPPLINGFVYATTTVPAGAVPVCNASTPAPTVYRSRLRASGLTATDPATDTTIINECLYTEWVPLTDTAIITGPAGIVWHRYAHQLYNRGNFYEGYRLWWNNDTVPRWSMEVEDWDSPAMWPGLWRWLAPGAYDVIEVEVAVPADVYSATNNATIWLSEYWDPGWVRDETLSPSRWRNTMTDTTLAQRAAVQLYPNLQARVWPGERVTYTHSLKNIGSLTDTYTLDGSNDLKWAMYVTPSIIYDLPPGGLAQVQAVLTVPLQVLSDSLDTALITATSGFDPSVMGVAQDLSTVRYVPAASIVPDYNRSADPGTSVVYTHTLTNLGNYTETFYLATQNSFGYAEVSGIPNPVLLGPWETSDMFTVTVLLPVHVWPGDVERTEVIAAFKRVPLQEVAVDTTEINFTPIPGTRYVAPTGSDNRNNCLDVGFGPCATIQHAINQAAPLDEVRIAQGQYTDRSTISDHTQVIYLDKSVWLHGGYAMTDWNNSRPWDYPSVINAQAQGRVIYIAGGIAPTIEGLHLRNGYINGNGGGLYAMAGSAPTLESNFIYSNTAQGGQGGGVYYPSGGTIHNTVFYTNTATLGGGVYLGSGNSMLLHNTLYDNTANNGGGVYQASGSAWISNSILIRNTALISGGALYVNTGSASLDYNDLWNNQPDDGNVPTGIHSIALDPLFLDAAGGDFHLGVGSPCLDGVTASPLTRDVDGDERPQLLAYDIGADEFAVHPKLELVPASYSGHTTHTHIVYTHMLTNAGNYEDIISLTASIDQPAWSVSLSPHTITLLPGDSTTVYVTVSVPGGTIGTHSTAIITATSFWKASVFAVARDTTVYQDEAELALSKSAQPGGWLKPGDSLSYRLVYTASGPAGATGVVISDPLSSLLVNPAFTASDPLVTPLAGSTYAWTVGHDMLPHTGGEINVTAQVDPSMRSVAWLNNTAWITTTQHDPTPANNIMSVTHWVDGAPPVVPAGALLNPPDQHMTSTQTINFTWKPFSDRYGDLDGSGVVSYELVISGSASFNAVVYSPTTSYLLSSMPYGVYSWTVRAFDAVGNVSSFAPVATFRSGIPDLTIGKRVQAAGTTATPVAGAPFSYHLTITNIGLGPATGVIVTDAVPAGAHYISGGSYDNATGVVTWQGLSVPPDGGLAQATWIVSACQAVTNDAYRVVNSTQGISSTWGPAVTTLFAAPATTADFAMSTNDAGIGQSISFSDTTTPDGGAAALWQWNFGDGQAGTGLTARHTYTQAGTFNVRLTLTDTCGFTRTASQPITVTSKPGIQVQPKGLQATLNPGDATTRTLTVSNTGTAGLNWNLAISPTATWLNVAPLAGSIAPSSSVEVNVRFNASGLPEGTYFTALWINSNDLARPHIVVLVQLDVVTWCIPVQIADFRTAPAELRVGRPVTFSANIVQGSQPFTYTWSLGNGALGYGPIVTHIYTAAMTYPVMLTVENTCYSMMSLRRSVNVVASEINIAPASLEATLNPAQVSSRTLMISNTGTASLTWQLSESPALDWLSAWPDSGTLAPAGQTGLTLTLTTPAATGVYTGWLRVSSDDPFRPQVSVAVTLSVIAPGIMITPTELAVTLNPGQNEQRAVVIGNSGDDDLTWTASEQPAVDWLSLAPGDGLVAPGGQVSIAVTFVAPTTTGSYTSLMRITSDDPNRPNVDIPVQLNVIAPDIEVTPMALAVTLGPGQTTRRVLTFNNTGTDDLDWALVETPPVGWLSASPGSGHAAPDASSRVTVTFDATGMNAGVYPTTLQINSNDPDENPLNVSVVLNVSTACIAVAEVEFGYTPAAPQTGQAVRFNASAGQGTPPISYTWDFGDGGGSFGAQVYHTFRLSATYPVTLTAVNACGGPLEVVHPISVSGTPFTPSYGLTLTPSDAQAGGAPGSQVIYHLTLRNTGNTADTFSLTTAGNTWVTGVQPGLVSLPPQAGAAVTATVALPDNASQGQYDTVTLSAASQGEPAVKASSRLTTTASASGCIAVSGVGFEHTPAAPQTGQAVTFTASAGAGTPPISYTWDFGDGGGGFGAQVYHTFLLSATYPVTLTAANACGGPLEVVHPVSVSGSPFTPSYGLTLTPSNAQASGLPGSQVVYHLTLRNTGNTADTFSLSTTGNTWVTGVQPNRVNLSPQASAAVAVTTTIPTGATPGQHDTVTLNAVSQGDPAAQASSRLTTTVSSACTTPSGAQLSFAPGQPMLGQTVTFTGTLTAGTAPFTYTWDFDDGPATVQSGIMVSLSNMTHVYAQAGDYQVALTVSNACGQVSTTSQALHVQPHRIYLPLVMKGHQ